VITGITDALNQAKTQLGISSHLILCFLRHLSEEAAFETLEEALPYKEQFIAVGLDSSEQNNPPEKFARVFEKARAEGLLTVAHAGEEGPPDYIRQALDLLEVSRIDHGVRCLEDAALVKRLSDSGMPLTVCPLSNIKLCVFPAMASHNLKQLLEANLCVTVNSDDPAYFGGYLTENYLASLQALNLSAQQLHTLLCNGFKASFLEESEKERYYQEINTLFAPWLQRS
jgi:adenosine deaminase